MPKLYKKYKHERNLKYTLISITERSSDTTTYTENSMRHEMNAKSLLCCLNFIGSESSHTISSNEMDMVYFFKEPMVLNS